MSYITECLNFRHNCYLCISVTTRDNKKSGVVCTIVGRCNHMWFKSWVLTTCCRELYAHHIEITNHKPHKSSYVTHDQLSPFARRKFGQVTRFKPFYLSYFLVQCPFPSFRPKNVSIPNRTYITTKFRMPKLFPNAIGGFAITFPQATAGTIWSNGTFTCHKLYPLRQCSSICLNTMFLLIQQVATFLMVKCKVWLESWF